MPVLTADMVPVMVFSGASQRLDAKIAAKFKPGDEIVARNINPAGHTRLPRYIRGKRGTIDRDHGVFVFPDTIAHGRGDKPQHVYSVRFEARELWGEDGHPNQSLYTDLWDDYMDPV